MPLVDADEGGDLLGRVAMVRRQIATELGLSLPPIRIRDNIQLGSHEYAVKIKGVEVARGSLMPGQLLAMNPGTADLPLDGIAHDRARLRPARRVDQRGRSASRPRSRATRWSTRRRSS